MGVAAPQSADGGNSHCALPKSPNILNQQSTEPSTAELKCNLRQFIELMEGDGARFGKERQAEEEAGPGNVGVKSDRNGIEGKLLAAEGRVEAVAAK